MSKTRSKKVSPKSAQDAKRTLAKVNILPNNWPEYLRKIGFSDIAVDRYLKKEDSVTPYWMKLKEKLSDCNEGIELCVQHEVNNQKRNEKIDDILVSNHVKKCYVRNRNRAWFLYDFLSQYANHEYMKHDIAQMKFELTDPQLSQIECDYRGNSLEQRYQMLSTWVRANNLTKLKKIAKALEQLDLVAPKIYKNTLKAGSSSQDSSSEEPGFDMSSDSCDDDLSTQKETKICTLKHACKQSALVQNCVHDSVPLQVMKKENMSQEKFGNSTSWSFRQQSDKNNITAENIFDKAAYTCDKKAKSSQEPVSKYQKNNVGVVGMAGIGKTTFCKSVLKNQVETHPESFVFYISSRDLNFKNKTKYNVLKFLLASTVHDYEHSPDSDKLILKKIKQSSDTLIVIDGLDEAKHKGNFSEYPSALELYDEKESAYNILMNLLNGRLLPNAKKLIAARPVAFQKFHPECKPLFMAQVLGLSPESRQLLCKQVCETEEQQNLVQKVLETQPTISALCFIPMFCKMIVQYMLGNLKTDKDLEKPISITDIFVEQLHQWQMRPRFETDTIHLKNLARLAFYGVKNHQFQFTKNDLAKYNLKFESIEQFMCMNAKTQEPGLFILDGNVNYFFIHATWQEFLAALYLMVFAPSEEFSLNVKELMQEVHWEVVTRFLFGFCQQQTKAKLEVIFSDAQVAEDRESLLKSNFLSLLPNLLSSLHADFPVSPADYYKSQKMRDFATEFSYREKDSTLFNICSWAYEAQDNGLTKVVANSLPYSLFLSREIFPHEVISFCHVLKTADKALFLNIGDWLEKATFPGNGLQILLSIVQQSKHKVKKLHVKNVDLVVVFGVISEMLNEITELTMENSNSPTILLEKLSDAISERKIHLSYLSLTNNDLNGAGTFLKKCVSAVSALGLDGCNLQADDFVSLSRAVVKRNTIMDFIDLSENEMSKNALDILAPSVHKLNGLILNGCSVNDEGLEQLCYEIHERQMAMDLFSLGRNNIGLIGVNHVSSCVHNICQVYLNACNLTGAHLQGLFAAIQNLKQPLKVLSIGGNQMNSKNVQMLAKCVHKTTGLGINNCGMNADAVKIVSNELKLRFEPMDLLWLPGNNIGDEGAIALAGCLGKVERLWISKHEVTSVGTEALLDANRTWKRRLYGFEHVLEDELYKTNIGMAEMAGEIFEPKKKRPKFN